MPCTVSGFGSSCHIFKHYCGVAQYHGELCDGCLWWENTPEDIEFRNNIARITGGKLIIPDVPDNF